MPRSVVRWQDNLFNVPTRCARWQEYTKPLHRERSVLRFNRNRCSKNARCYGSTETVAARTLGTTVQPKPLQRERSVLRFNQNRCSENARCYGSTETIAARTLGATVQPKPLQRQRSLLQFNLNRCSDTHRCNTLTPLNHSKQKNTDTQHIVEYPRSIIKS